MLVHEPDERAIAESGKPGGRPGIAMIGEPAPQPARIGRSAPERAIERIGHDFDQVGRLFGIRRAKADAVQIKFRPAVLWQRDPVSVNLLEQGPRRIGAIAGVRER